jgi:1-deoxy-D-xylulose-5-phosphate reductoisomerase
VDGSILAQISVTDMRLPILYAMSFPERVPSELTFDMASLGQLSFEPPDFGKFPCLRLAYQAAETGGAACIALNAADEVAVGAFLEGTIPFTSIPRTIETGSPLNCCTACVLGQKVALLTADGSFQSILR